MTRAALDISGKRFGRLIAISRNGVHMSPSRPHLLWLCRCDCGNMHTARLNALRTGSVSSCGCARIGANLTHGKVRTKEYAAWAHMKDRCYNKNSLDYPNYGARGIQVCERWKNSFESFLEDMGLSPGAKFSIDRINNDDGYNPENCRWADAKTQSRNKRNNVWYSHNGKTMILSDWAKHCGIHVSSMLERIARHGFDHAVQMKKEN